MSMAAVPCCAQCGIVKNEKIRWAFNDPSARTAEKLNACTICHFDKYCSKDCQIQHWTKHMLHCVPVQKKITSQEVDDIVKTSGSLVSGKIAIYLDSNKNILDVKSLEKKQDSTLSVDVMIDGKKVENYQYRLQRSSVDRSSTLTNLPDVIVKKPVIDLTDEVEEQGMLIDLPEAHEKQSTITDLPDVFDWQAKLKEICSPLEGDYEPMEQVALGYEMIEKGLCLEAFKMMAENTPKNYPSLPHIFFPNAMQLMREQDVGIKLIISCAKLLDKNFTEVDALLNPPMTKELSQNLQGKVQEAQKLPHDSKDLAMMQVAAQIIDLRLYDQAFDLMIDAGLMVKCTFLRISATTMISNKLSYEKIVQLATKIKLSEYQILNELVDIYAQQGDIQFACDLAQRSHQSDSLLRKIFNVLLDQERFEEATSIIHLVAATQQKELSKALNDRIAHPKS